MVQLESDVVISKFLPVIGRFVVDTIEDKLSQDLVDKFAIDRHVRHRDRSRSGYPVELDVDQLCVVEDLHPSLFQGLQHT
jgi:hypothetical protein